MKNIVRLDFLVLMLIFCFNKVSSASDNCNFGTCGECISFAGDTCVWCSQDDFNGRRCQSLSYINTTECKKEFIYNPEPNMFVKENKDFSDNIQFKPQLIQMKMRPGVEMSFKMSYKPAKDFPLDVYYLMDTSFTMISKVSDLKNQASTIYSQLTNYTNNVRLGAGSFVEKPAFPYFDKNEKQQSHAFKNIISLTNNMTEFKHAISNINFGSNYDDSEAGLDALMQAMTCENELGWRKGARRIIVLSTDSTYHSAGDGKIVGAIKPHDMKCYLENNLYTMALTYDYPSVSQINRVATKGNFIIIFAIAESYKINGSKRKDVVSYRPEIEYKALTKQIIGSKYANLENGTSVIEIIKKAYEESRRTVELDYKLDDFIELTVDQDCNSKPTRNCESTHTEPTVTINGKLTVKSCPHNKKFKQEVKVNIVGLEDKLTIELDIDCECECEKHIGAISAQCHNAGVRQCGICKCNPGSYGVDCRCNGTSTDQKDLDKCVMKGGAKYCNGHGFCRCGKCEECNEGYSGDFCEFSDYSCPSSNTDLCSGNGKCTRGHCVCKEGWTREDCSCPLSNKNCIAPNSKEVCSGNGICECGVCLCNKLETRNETYSGVFCDSCDECAEKRCKELEDYAYCNYEHMDDKSFCDQQNNDTTKDIKVSFVNKTEINAGEWYVANWCKKILENGTYIVFKYKYNDTNLKLHLGIQKESGVPPVANIWVAAGWAIGLVLLIGIITVIIWKILVDLHDKREYKKFEQEAAAAGYDVSLNLIYQPPTNVYSNPVFNECN